MGKNFSYASTGNVNIQIQVGLVLCPFALKPSSIRTF